MPEYKRPISSKDYWEQRSLEVSEDIWKDTKVVEREMAMQFRLTQEDMKKELQDFISRYGTENKLSYDEAVKALTAGERASLVARIQRLQQRIISNPDSSQFLKAEVQKIVAKLQFDRLSGLLSLLEIRSAELTEEAYRTTESHLKKTFGDSYYRTLFDLDNAVTGVSFVGLNEQAIEQAITYRWSGEQFSDRIWQNRDLLVREMRQGITQGLIQGTSTQKMTRQLVQTLDNTYFNVNRVVRTETAFALNEGANQGYINSGVVSEYIFIATLDGRTSGVCGSLDGKVFKMSERQIGTNAPVMHPFCRSTTAPYFGSLPVRRAREGAINEVIENQSFEDWKRTNFPGL